MSVAGNSDAVVAVAIHAEQNITCVVTTESCLNCIDIAACNYIPKPHPDAFGHFIGHSAADARKAAMFEDIARNLVVPHQMGMRTVWVHTEDAFATEKAHHGKDGDHVHHTTEDLVGFLDAL